MRIVWQNDRFEAELTPGDLWASDKDAAQDAGLKCDGPPNWTWFTTKASVLNKLRKNKPQSDLTLTQLAFERYQSLNKQDEEKAALKKQFEQANKQAKKEAKDENEYYLDEGTGIQCIVVKPGGPMKHKHGPFKDMSLGRCLVCDDPLYFYEAKNICLFCEIILDKEKKV